MRTLVQRAALLVTLLLCGVAAVASLAYWRAGGDMASLGDAIVRTVQGEGLPRGDGPDWRAGMAQARDFGTWIWGWAWERRPSIEATPSREGGAGGQTATAAVPEGDTILEPGMEPAEERP